VTDRPEVADHYGTHYRDFGSDVYAQVRQAAFGEDLGQNSWLTLAQLERFVAHLDVRAGDRLLDVACGSGGPAVRVASLTGCDVVGVDLYRDAVTNQRRSDDADKPHARFLQADASKPLPFVDASFDAVVCIDAINHLPDRLRVLEDWARVLRPGGRLVFTDPVSITGALDSAEIATRTSIGYFLFVPAEENRRLIDAAGFDLLTVEDTTVELAETARRRGAARDERAAELRRVEGDAAFEGRQRFFAVVAELAAQARLSRLAYVAKKRGQPRH
jgi:SAM-dependent methyltransferase